jgi:ribonuclease-3
MDEYLRMSKGERMDTQKGRQHILANTFEAFVGAMYLDQGYGQARDFIANQLFPKLDAIIEHKLFRDPKSYFQEQAQERERITPHYELIGEEGPDHDKEFVMAVYLENEEVARGKGPSKQKAETSAAQNALQARDWE